MSTEFPAFTVVSSFRLAEQMLSDMLQVVPYSKEHEHVWSPQLATVLLEACSQLDSLWKARSGRASARLDIRDYFAMFGGDVAERWLVFWGETGVRVQPFAAWSVTPNHSKDKFTPLDWWQAYNDLKHSRLANRKRATLRHAAHAVAGLFVAIVRCPECASAVAHEGWIPSPGRLGMDAEYLLSDDANLSGVVAETTLLSYPLRLEWKPGRPRLVQTSVRGGSYRFQTWCAENGLGHWEQ